jgi:hypothetical protein
MDTARKPGSKKVMVDATSFRDEGRASNMTRRPAAEAVAPTEEGSLLLFAQVLGSAQDVPVALVWA